MHMTLETDYAVRIVSCLVTAGRRMDAKSIAEETSVTLRFSLKILRKLVAGGIIKSYKGTQGGYELAREPKEISLNDVIETVEGPFYISRCLGGDYQCGHNDTSSGCSCPFREVYDQISEDVSKRLKAFTFDMLLSR
ncbi:MAG: Rrf2 family transcriptional regulator [Oscillospiraceae bacterium]|nr:Rrf2 family transcriptional regulator [Oscillospiraceae bacterium]